MIEYIKTEEGYYMDKMAYEQIDGLISKGYTSLETHDSKAACDSWLTAWKEALKLMASEGIAGIHELEEKYEWEQLPTNWVQDLEEELHNAGLDDPEYFRKRIQYCEEMLKVYPEEKADTLLTENTRRAIAESYYELGDTVSCNVLFEKWLKDDPQWGWGWIGWSACYWRDHRSKNAEKGQSILERGLAVEEVRDREDLLDNARELYTETKQSEKAAKADAELKEILSKRKAMPAKRGRVNQPVHVVKIGRNEPCPCGSGKKYKKCCGK
jgi:hypothetical protein